jgi:hypothetical protein
MWTTLMIGRAAGWVSWYLTAKQMEMETYQGQSSSLLFWELERCVTSLTILQWIGFQFIPNFTVSPKTVVQEWPFIFSMTITETSRDFIYDTRNGDQLQIQQFIRSDQN